MNTRAHQPLHLLTRTEFLWRQLRYAGAALGLMLLSLGMGMLGYHLLAHIDWIDSLLNASMILSGMGPIASLHSAGAKLFASAYALYSGVVYLAVSAVLLYPLVERLMKILHLQALHTPSPVQEKHHPELSEDES